jgi:chromosome segregation ATPase
VVDLAQGTFGGLASLGGPVGLALGGLAALIGLTFSGLSSSADENAAKAAQSIQDMYADMAESGEKFVSQDFVNQKIQEIIGNQDELNKVKQQAAQASISAQTALRAEAGDQAALNTALEGAIAKRDELSKRIDTVVQQGGKVSGELRGEADAAQDLVLHYQNLAANQDTARAKADLYAQSITNTAAATADATGKTAGFQSALSNLRDKTVKISVDDADAREHLRQLGKAINVDMYVTPRTGRGIN